MNQEQINDYLLSKPEAFVDQLFGDGVEVYRVKHKMFATLALGKMGKNDDDRKDWWLNLKCDPDEAIMLREIFPSIILLLVTMIRKRTH